MSNPLSKTGSLVRREKYSFHHQHIANTHELRATLRAGGYAWPGGYPLFLVTEDGEALHFSCAKHNYRQVSHAVRTQDNDSWRVVACEVNWEDMGLCCADCGERIECAYPA